MLNLTGFGPVNNFRPLKRPASSTNLAPEVCDTLLLRKLGAIISALQVDDNYACCLTVPILLLAP